MQQLQFLYVDVVLVNFCLNCASNKHMNKLVFKIAMHSVLMRAYSLIFICPFSILCAMICRDSFKPDAMQKMSKEPSIGYTFDIFLEDIRQSDLQKRIIQGKITQLNIIESVACGISHSNFIVKTAKLTVPHFKNMMIIHLTFSTIQWDSQRRKAPIDQQAY